MFHTPTQDELAEMHLQLDRAGVPYEFRRYQVPVTVGCQNDIEWLRFAVSMWRRSYEVCGVCE
jgi:hypothetical protein